MASSTELSTTSAHKVVEAGRAGAADVHSGPFADGLEALEDLDCARVVRIISSRGRMIAARRRSWCSLLVCQGSNSTSSYPSLGVIHRWQSGFFAQRAEACLTLPQTPVRVPFSGPISPRKE